MNEEQQVLLVHACGVRFRIDHFGDTLVFSEFLRYAQNVWPGADAISKKVSARTVDFVVVLKSVAEKAERVTINEEHIEYHYKDYESLIGATFLVLHILQKHAILRHEYFFHSAAIIADRGSILIVGDGGVGKTTISRTIAKELDRPGVLDEWSIVKATSSGSFLSGGAPSHLLHPVPKRRVAHLDAGRGQNASEIKLIILPHLIEDGLIVNKPGKIRSISRLMKFSGEVVNASQFVMLSGKSAIEKGESPDQRRQRLNDMRLLSSQVELIECYGTQDTIARKAIEVLSERCTT
jgi:hypothetical protein